jgi:hypothetical protein
MQRAFNRTAVRAGLVTVLMVCVGANLARHVMPSGYAPAVVGIGLVLVARRGRWLLLIGALVSTVGVVTTIAGWKVPLSASRTETAVTRAQGLKHLGPHPYCFHAPEIDPWFFGRAYECYPHHVVVGKITSAENAAAEDILVSDSRVTAILTEP